MWENIRKPAGAIMLAILAAGSYVFDIPPRILQEWWPLIFFAFFCFYIGWYIFGQDKTIRELQKGKPKIEVVPQIYNNRFVLQIGNSGGGTNITIRGMMVKGDLPSEIYDIEACQINKNDRITVPIAEIANYTDESVNIFKGWLALHKMTASGKQMFGACSQATKEKYELYKRYPTMDQQAPPSDACVVEIILSTDTAPIKALDSLKYSLRVDREHGYKLTFDACQ